MIGILLADVLAGMGHDVCAVEATEADAVTAAVRCRPDLMIVDVRLGVGSGIAAVDEILRNEPVPHVFVSGDISSLQTLRPRAVMLQKPFREPDLVRAIENALGAAGTS